MLRDFIAVANHLVKLLVQIHEFVVEVVNNCELVDIFAFHLEDIDTVLIFALLVE